MKFEKNKILLLQKLKIAQFDCKEKIKSRDKIGVLQLFSLFHTRNNAENNRGEATALMELVLATLPKIYLFPTQDSVGTIREEVQFIFKCDIVESANSWTLNTVTMKIKSSVKTTSEQSSSKVF
jgi:hypothetical protein